MGARTERGLVVAVALGVALRVAPAAAFTMAEQMATTGVHGALSSTSAPSASRTIGSVKKNLSASTPRLSSVRGPAGPGAGAPGSGAPDGKRSASSKSGWGTATKGWAKAGAASGKAAGSWAGPHGGWAKSEGWASNSKTWTSSKGRGWARPGGKS